MLCFQKYRLSLKRQQDAIQRAIIRRYHPSPTFNPLKGIFQFLKPQFLMTGCQTEFGSHFQKPLNSPMPMPSLGSAQFAPHLDSYNYDMSIPNYEHLPAQNHQLYSACNSGHFGISTTSDGELASFDQMANHNVEEIPTQAMNLSRLGISGCEYATHGPTFLGTSQQLQQQQFLLPQKDHDQTLSSFINIQSTSQQQPLLPPPPQPKQEEADMFEDGKFDELFDIASALLSDIEDHNDH